MTIGAWNIGGLCDGKKRTKVKEIVKGQKLEIFGLLETKVRG